MLSFENYKENVDIIDKFDTRNIQTCKSVLRRHIKAPDKGDSVKSECIPPLAAAFLGLNNTAAPCYPCSARKPELKSAWTDIDVQELYLNSKPTCYLILSKPGAGAFTLGEAVSKKYNCVHLCPRNILVDEIEQNSPTGKCIDFNMRHNKVCKIDSIMPILKKKLESPAVQHRGYVLSGLPLVTTNMNSEYFTSSLQAEESVVAVQDLLTDLAINFKKKKAKKKPPGSETSVNDGLEMKGEEEEHEEEEEEEEEPEDAEEEEEIAVELPKFILQSCEGLIFTKKDYIDTKKAILLDQLTDLFSLQLKPDIIIYITCPDADMVTKKCHKYFDYKSNLNVVDPYLREVDIDLRWPAKYSLSEYTSPYDNNMSNSKYNCKQPMNFKARSIEQLCNYKHNILPFVEDKIKDFNPKHIIKLDGRTFIHHMMHQVTERLNILPIVKPVIIPEPMYLEEPPDEMDEFWKLVEEFNTVQSGVVKFNRFASPWYNRCPVELKKRLSLKGKFKLAVTFFKHVYLLSSLDALITFCRNPRPFLRLHYLEPTCRIIVLGTKSSGKTMISECLAWLFDAPIIHYPIIYNKEKQKKYDIFAMTILSEIIATIEDIRFSQWQSKETERMAMLDEWNNSALTTLKKYVSLFVESTRQQAKDSSDQGQFPALLSNINRVKNKLSFLPNLDDVEECRMLLKNKNLKEYAPVELTNETTKPTMPVIGDQDVTQAISDYIVTNDLQKDIDPTPEEMMKEFISIISTIDSETKERTNLEELYGKFIIDDFPSDPEFWGLLGEAKLLPDYTIALIENREIETGLMANYDQIEKYHKNHPERFLLADDPFIKIKLKTKHVSDSKTLDVTIIVYDLIANALDSLIVKVEDPEKIVAFTQSIDKFREDWDSLKVKLEESFKSSIEIELENKSDVQVVEEMLLKLKQSYSVPCEINEDAEFVDQEEENETPKDMLTFNDPHFLCETNLYCPIAFYDHGVLWEGKQEFGFKYNNKVHFFSKEECSEIFRKDVSKYESYNKPFKKIPPLRICVMGCIGSGKTTISKFIAKELGLIHIDFENVVNDFLMPRHIKKVGRQYENSFIDNPIDEEAVVEFQMGEENENLVSDILSNEAELRRMVFNYFERGMPLIPVLMQKLIKKLWFEDPFVNKGFVIDGFPRLPNDVEDMVACFCIPDLVIELECSSEISLERLSTPMFKKWKMQQNEAKNVVKEILERNKQEWVDFITEQVVIKIMYDDIVENALSSLIIDEPVTDPSRVESVIIDAHPSGSSNVDANLFNTYNHFVELHPEPVDTSEWEKAEDARERIDSRLEGIYESDDENIQSLKDTIFEQKIKIIFIDGTKPLNKILRTLLLKLSTLRNRCQSLFEQTFIVSSDIAEMLLSEGICFISKFHRMCPVYIYDNPHVILNPYKNSKQKDKICPIVHRSYIYFINGEENLKKFRIDPLKYIIAEKILKFQEYPLRIGIIGPPKSGKSELASKLAKRYGLICISRGLAVRNILENMHWTELASRMKVALESGECIDTDLIIAAVQTGLIDYRTVTQGFILDGFPETPSEATKLSKIGLYPLIMFDCASNKKTIVENSQNECHLPILKTKPPYSQPFIEYRYTNWYQRHCGVRNYIKDDFQNLFILNGNESKWQCLQDANNCIDEVVPKINYYLNNVNSKIVPVDVMCISNEIFEQRMSCFKNMCPLCLRRNTLRHSGYPVDRKGVVQYNNLFYWVCADHINYAMKHPERYLLSQTVNIPEVPAVVKTVDNVSLVYENGICIVTYAENLPNQRILTGNKNFAANFQGKIYLFCNDSCLQKFLARPHMYYDIVIFKESKIFPQISLKHLPDIGYLEQTVGQLLTEACCSVNVLRPKYPGLDIKLSALLHIGLYLKTHNPLIEKADLDIYRKVYNVYYARSKLILNLGLRLRSMDNPFAKYPKCCNPLKSDSDTVCKPSSFVSPSTISSAEN